MTILRYRIKLLLLYGMIGACLTGIPLLMVLIHQNYHSLDLKQQVSYYQAQEENSRYLTVWILKENIAAGDEITRALLLEQQVRISDADGVNSMTDLTQITGKTAKTALTKGTILQADFLYDGELCSDDIRKKELSFVQLPSALQKNDYIDIRIGYPDGEDYIIVKHKRVLELIQEGEEEQTTGISLELSEEEQLRLSAARIDVNTYEDTLVYAIQYREDFQQAAVADYPVNEAVFDLMGWDPNVTDRSIFTGEQSKRRILEKNLEPFKLESEGISQQQQQQTDDISELPDITGQEELSELEIFE